jgi:hypothetical protein
MQKNKLYADRCWCVGVLLVEFCTRQQLTDTFKPYLGVHVEADGRVPDVELRLEGCGLGALTDALDGRVGGQAVVGQVLHGARSGLLLLVQVRALADPQKDLAVDAAGREGSVVTGEQECRSEIVSETHIAAHANRIAKPEKYVQLSVHEYRE